MLKARLKLPKINILFVILSIFFLPLISLPDYRIPVRPSEIIFCLFLATYILSLLIGINKYPKSLNIFIGFFFLYFFFYLNGLINVDDQNFNISYPFYGLMKLFLLFICLLLFYFSLKLFKLNQLVNLWTFSFIFFFSLHLSIYLFEERLFIKRSGLFFEGNIAGLYYLISLMIFNIYRKFFSSNKLFVFTFFLAMVGIYFSHSTMAFIALFIYFIMNINQKFLLKNIIFIFIILVVNFKYIVYKIPFLTFTEQVYSFSFANRLKTISESFEIFKENIFFGSGFASFGFVRDNFVDYEISSNKLASVNNVYFNTLSDTGLIGFLITCIFFWFFIFNDMGKKKLKLFILILPILFYLNSFPTLYVPFLWVSLAIFKLLVKNSGN